MTNPQPDRLERLVTAASEREVPAEVTAIAEAVRDAVGAAAVAVLAYGSCLRGVSTDDSLVDLYILVDGYDRLAGNRVLRLLNRLIPPNVYYAECRHGSRIVRAKYAVVSLGQFERRVAPETRNPYFWARFAQPTAIVFADSARTRARVLRALCRAAETMVGEGRRLAGSDADPETVWVAALTATYATELRSEGPARAREIVAANRDFYRAVAEAATPGNAGAGGGSPALRRIEGKALSVARLIKAAFTFTGGADYLAWKIARHSGVAVELTPWQRRHPILAALVLFPRLYARGAFR
jgi:hypothetical protein